MNGAEQNTVKEMKEMSNFQYHKPSEHALEVLSKLRAHCEEHEKLVLKLLPAGRCRSLALTKLEEVSMWESKACVLELEKENRKTKALRKALGDE